MYVLYVFFFFNEIVGKEFSSYLCRRPRRIIFLANTSSITPLRIVATEKPGNIVSWESVKSFPYRCYS